MNKIFRVIWSHA
ncbi:hypothetical protein F9888_10325, partial [Glaesserella parasuis]|nr:hypothetical protein [Glaesserella parasuis]